MIRKEIGVFLIVGSLTVLVDFLGYRLSLRLGIDYAFAKVIGFIVGTVFAYFANKYGTFGHVDHAPNIMPRFVALYMITLCANVLVNQATLEMLGHTSNILPDFFAWILNQIIDWIGARATLVVNLAFLVATGVSAMLNFLGMKFLVFKQK